ncbi:D-Ala-D-Ala carboxypeptidase family metallohydrolase [Aquimarina pacifica]|uniref:D-Ala-D-Ala carboxypeptidase family metallohydrolase n=1 Tax=Aquimarina pacifica TaxID=1296415 RepID=UPI0004BA2BAF|nr:D-Ala-D-Ala carboxypeptidase family metallohydrolase [Aquimarina pacifica]
MLYALGVVSCMVIGAIVLSRMKLRSKIDLTKFDSPDSPGSGICMDKRLIEMLTKLAKLTKLPIFEMINSGARTPFWNRKVGGVSNSAHKTPKCMAVDIKAPTLAIRNKLVVAAKLVGFKRIGVANTFVHLDVDATKSQNVAWGYPSGTKPPINPFT